MKEPRERIDEFERALAVVVGVAARQDALQGLAEALKFMLQVFPPEFDYKWAESSGEKIQVLAWDQASAALDAARPFLEKK